MGIRTLNWVEQCDAYGTSFQLEVNGHHVHARGANVVPPDFHDTHNPDRWTKLVTQALGANMNMVRVWGGGVYPPDAFFEACDQAGLLVWQDFMFACSMVPDDPAFVENVRQEAVEQVRRLRNHPSLALWCGNNEVERAWTSWGWQDMYDLHGPDSVRLAETPMTGCSMSFSPKLCRRNPTFTTCRLHRPSMPKVATNTHGAFGLGLKILTTTVVTTGALRAEYGLQSLPCKHTLKEAGITSWEDEALQFRQRSRMDWLEPGFDGWDMMHHFMSKTTGAPAEGDLDDWIFKSQWAQAEGIRQALERHRTSRGRFAGSLYWSLNDVWPAVSWSTVDHAGRWKLAHHAARRANAPRTALWVRYREDSLCFQAFNDLPEPTSGVMQIALKDFTGQVLRQMEFRGSAKRQAIVHDQGWVHDPMAHSTDGHLPKLALERWFRRDVGTVFCPVVCSCRSQSPSFGRQCVKTDEGFEVSADSYVSLVQLLASVPGRWSDNGMSLEPGQPVNVHFRAESEAKLEFDVEIRSLENPTQ